MIKNQYGELVRDTVANFTNFKDGDYQSVITEGDEWKKDSLALGSGQMYSSAAGTSAPRISDHSRVYKVEAGKIALIG